MSPGGGGCVFRFIGLWDKAFANRVVGALWPHNPDGHGKGDQETGCPTLLAAKGDTLVDPDHDQGFSDDVSAQISAFKPAGFEMLTGPMPLPHFTMFRALAAQRGFTLKVGISGRSN